MNFWMVASIVMLAAFIPCGWLALTDTVEKRLVGMETAGVVCTLHLMLLVMAFNRMPMMDLALALALLSFGAGMLFAQMLARHL
jgi:multisubunit Na+/H+ antiporter MnhF subunit